MASISLQYRFGSAPNPQSGGMQIMRINGFWIASRACERGMSGFVAWGKRKRILASGPLHEPVHDEVWCVFAPTRDRAIARLLADLPHEKLKMGWLQKLKAMIQAKKGGRG